VSFPIIPLGELLDNKLITLLCPPRSSLSHPRRCEWGLVQVSAGQWHWWLKYSRPADGGLCLLDSPQPLSTSRGQRIFIGILKINFSRCFNLGSPRIYGGLARIWNLIRVTFKSSRFNRLHGLILKLKSQSLLLLGVPSGFSAGFKLHSTATISVFSKWYLHQNEKIRGKSLCFGTYKLKLKTNQNFSNHVPKYTVSANTYPRHGEVNEK
jgi:hypothetical protein